MRRRSFTYRVCCVNGDWAQIITSDLRRSVNRIIGASSPIRLYGNNAQDYAKACDCDVIVRAKLKVFTKL
jgi:hypothetical protein